MSRTINVRRPEELREAIVRYLVKHGLADLSLRPLAKAVGSSPRMLLYYFGSKEKMVACVLADIRRRQRAAYAQIETSGFAEEYEAVWKQMSAPDSEPYFRLFFEIYGMALRHPKPYRDFLHHTVEHWLRLIAVPLCRKGCTPTEARAFASIVLAGLRGFMLDYCTTHDRRRLDSAVCRWLSAMEAIVPGAKV